MPKNLHYNLELWNVDGTILNSRSGPEPFPDWQEGQQATDDLVSKPFIVRSISDTSNEKDGIIYFRRFVRVAAVN